MQIPPVYCASPFFFRSTEIAHKLFVSPDQKKPQVVILPMAQQDGQFSVDVESSNMPNEINRLKGILENTARENPRTEGGIMEEMGPPLVSVLDPLFLGSIVEEKQSNILVAFCKKGLCVLNLVSSWYISLNIICIIIFINFYLHI